MLAYRKLAFGVVLILSCSIMTGAEYRGDQSRSPFMRFLHNLFWGESGSVSNFSRQPQGPTYRFPALSLGSSKTGATFSAGSSSQQDIWAGYGSESTTTGSSRKLSSVRSSVSRTTGKSNVLTSSSESREYVTPLSTATALSSSSASSSPSSGVMEATAISFPSLLAFQTTQQTLSTAAATSSKSSQGEDDGWGDDPTDPQIPLPVGDGTLVLLFFASIYVYLTRKRFIRPLFQA